MCRRRAVLTALALSLVPSGAACTVVSGWSDLQTTTSAHGSTESPTGGNAGTGGGNERDASTSPSVTTGAADAGRDASGSLNTGVACGGKLCNPGEGCCDLDVGTPPSCSSRAACDGQQGVWFTCASPSACANDPAGSICCYDSIVETATCTSTCTGTLKQTVCVPGGAGCTKTNSVCTTGAPTSAFRVCEP